MNETSLINTDDNIAHKGLDIYW